MNVVGLPYTQKKRLYHFEKPIEQQKRVKSILIDLINFLIALSRSNVCNYIQRIMSKDRNILNLLQLRKEVEKETSSNKQNAARLHSSIGLIVDCSNVYKYETNRDYTQKLKIIDSTSPNEPTQVYLWSNRRQDFTLNIKVGDILFFNNFKTELYNNTLQAKKAFKTEDSYFRIFSGNTELSNYSPIDKKVGLDDEDGKILAALGNLRAFSKTYFRSNRVSLLFKQEGKAKDQKKVTSSDFDLILRVIESVEFQNHYKIRLTSEKDEFQLNYPRYIEPGVYKVRSVADVKWEQKYGSLTGNDYTFFLEISNWMKSYDPKEWDRLVSSFEPNKKKVRRATIQSKVLNTNKKIKKVTLKELFTRDDHNQEVRVSCEVMDVVTPFEEALRKYDAQNNTEKSKQSETAKFVYSIHLLISDESMAGEVCNAYIYTYDQKGLEFLPDLNPSNIYGRNILNMKENYDNFVNRLVEQSDVSDAPVELILSPLFNGKETIYRIVSTELLF